MSKLTTIVVGIISACFILCGFTLFLLTYVGPTSSMKELSSVTSNSSLYMYTQRTFKIEMRCCGFVIFISGLLLLLMAFFGKGFVIFLGYIASILSIIIALGMTIFYGYTYFSLASKSDSMQTSELSKYEIAVCTFNCRK